MVPEPAFTNTATTALIPRAGPANEPAWTRTFHGDNPEQVSAARHWSLALLPGGRNHPAAFLLELTLSELCTNATLHTHSGDPGGTFQVELRPTPDGIWIGVHDQGADTQPATPGDVAPAIAESGRGLQLLGTLVERWGHELTQTGRLVWCIVPGG